MLLHPRLRSAALLLVSAAAAAACGEGSPNGSSGKTDPGRTVEPEKAPGQGAGETKKAKLGSFSSKDELAAFLKEHAKRSARARSASKAEASAADGAAPAAAPAEAAKQEESVTNNQTAGVDEGGIVKMHGDHMVVLRRGRLFTVRVAGGDLTPVSTVDAFAPGLDGRGAWYDEMLVHDNQVIVIGYSYARGGTEVGLFDIDREGRLAHRSTYHLRSNDYYSSRNYASRLIGDKLVFYTPLYLNASGTDPFASFPAIRKWHTGANESEFVSLVDPVKVYRPLDPDSAQALHTVTSCDLSKGDLACESTIVMGPAGRVFYVSQDSVYVWMTPWQPRPSILDGASRSLLYRMPLDGSAPGVVRVQGAPIDQFSFNQEDGFLHVLVRADGNGDAMWSAETKPGDLAAVRVPLSSFDGEAVAVKRDAYTSMPKPGNGWALTNRFVAGTLLYGAGQGWGQPTGTEESFVVAYRYGDRGEPKKVHLGHGVDRIEALGKDALVVGSSGSDLVFSAVELDASPGVAGKYVRRGASQGETRSHGFFYKADGDRSGIFGLPIRSTGGSAADQLRHGSASIAFVRNDALDFRELGELASSSENGGDDGCKASCVDWYGNARPIFVKGRTFALLGYEIVEGKLDGARMVETRRVSFSPAPLAVR